MAGQIAIPALHIIEVLTGGRILDRALDLVGFTLAGDEEQGTLAAGLDVGLRLAEEIVGNGQMLVIDLANTRRVDRIQRAVLINGRENDGCVPVFPCLQHCFW